MVTFSGRRWRKLGGYREGFKNIPNIFLSKIFLYIHDIISYVFMHIFYICIHIYMCNKILKQVLLVPISTVETFPFASYI